MLWASTCERADGHRARSAGDGVADGVAAAGDRVAAIAR
jgi:hypothetical protein